MRKTDLLIASLGSCFLVLFFALPAYAADRIQPNPSQGCVLSPTGYFGTADIPSLGCLAQIITSVVEVAFLFLGFVALIFLLYGAIRFIVSRGDPKALQAARNTMTYAIIGTVLILLAFATMTIFTNALGLPNILQNFTFYQGP